MSLGLLLVALVACGVNHSRGNSTVVEHVDLIEQNHFFDAQGRHVYDQIIFYELSPQTGQYHVRAWCLVEEREALNRRPVKNETTQLYQVDWYDTDQRVLRQIKSRIYRESWSQVDPERANKKLLEERSRTLLVQSPKRYRAELERQQLQSEDAALEPIVTPTTTLAIQTRISANQR